MLLLLIFPALHLKGAEESFSNAQKNAAALRSSIVFEGGLIVHAGCSDGRMTAALCRDDRTVVRGFARSREHAAQARSFIAECGLYGKVSVQYWKNDRLPLVNDLANCIVVSPGAGITEEEIFRVLAPGGWYVHLEDGNRAVKRKPRPVEIDQWTHYLHGPDNNAVSGDLRVGPPGHLRWKAAPMWCRSHEFASSVHVLVSADGRLFGIIDQGVIGQPRGVPALWTLVARDAFNGILLWERPCAQINRHAFAAVGDKLYVTLKKGGPLCILDAATGTTLHECESTGRVDELLLSDGVLFLKSRLDKKQGSPGKPGWFVVAADSTDGRILWKKRVAKIERYTFVAGGGRLCFFNGKELVCLEQETGKELWRTASEKTKGGYAVVYKGVVVLTGGGMRVFSLETGKFLWKGPQAGSHAREPPGLFGAGGLLWQAWSSGQPRTFVWEPREEIRNGYDPLTGNIKKSVTAKRLVSPGHHIRCYPPKATERYLLLNKRGVEFFDLQGERHMRANWTRGACGFGVLPANGLLYVPPHQCFCYPGVKLSGFNALSERIDDGADGAEKPQPLLKGSAWERRNQAEALVPAPADWPTYRHDPQRSGAVSFSLPVEPVKRWEVQLGGTATPPVCAAGRVYVAVPDSHAVCCLDAENGRKLWSYTADARVDSPPTIFKQLVLFGATDGNVYCLHASDGSLVWRFTAAPRQRMISVFGQLESAWPVHGSVLVFNGKVYFTAGRSSFLDGGIFLYALNPDTGAVLHKTHLKSEPPDTTQYAGRPFDMEGAHADLLVAGKKDIYLFQKRFSGDLTEKPVERITKLGDAATGLHLMCNDGFLDKTWFNRTYWTYSDRWPGYYFVFKAPKSGQILVFNDAVTCGLKVYRNRVGHSPEFQPGTGYELFADRTTTKPVLRPEDIGREKGMGFSRTELPIWSVLVPIRVQGMVFAGDRLYIAGPPDLASPEEAFASMRGKRGSLFRVVSASDGSKLFECMMKRVPVFDGLIAARGRLYMTTTDGTLICFGEGEDR